MTQVQLATLAYPQIGSITSITESGEPIIGKLSTAAAEGLVPQGPFSTAIEFFTAIGQASFRKAKLRDEKLNQNLDHFSRLGASVFLDIVQTTGLFDASQAYYPLNHMDLGTQNIIVDDNFNFLGLIDWEFAQTAPWQVNYYPMPFPLLWSDSKIKDALDDPTHPAHKNVSRQSFARQLYSEKFRDAERMQRKKGQPLGWKFSEVLDSPASRIYACFTELGGSAEQDAELVREMVRLAFGFDAKETDGYLENIGV